MCEGYWCNFKICTYLNKKFYIVFIQRHQIQFCQHQKCVEWWIIFVCPATSIVEVRSFRYMNEIRRYKYYLWHYNIVDDIKSKWHTFSSLMFNYSHLHIISWYYLHIKSSLVCLYVVKALQYASSFFNIFYDMKKTKQNQHNRISELNKNLIIYTILRLFRCMIWYRNNILIFEQYDYL